MNIDGVGRALALAVLLASPSGLLAAQEAPGRRQKERKASLVDLPADFVRYARVPEDGRLPRVEIGAEELVVLYFKGGDEGGDLFLARSHDEGATFGPSLRVNEKPGTVASWEGMDSGALALGPDGGAHVAWVSNEQPAHLAYAREKEPGVLAPAVDLGAHEGLRGTAAVAVGADGRVYLVHGTVVPSGDADPVGRIWLQVSDDGLAFGEPVAIDREGDGFSDRSGLAAHVDAVKGTLYIFYRTAIRPRPGEPAMVRGMRLLSSEDRGETFETSTAENHRQQRDPGSRSGLVQQKDTTMACWGEAGFVCWAPIRRGLNKVNQPIQPNDGRDKDVLRSRQAVAAGPTEVLFAWLESPKDDREAPPKLAWKVWLYEGRLPQGEGFAPDLPGDTAPAVIPRRAGGFTILY